MAKKKQKEYLPLMWSRNLHNQLMEALPDYTEITGEELWILFDSEATESDTLKLIKKYPLIGKVLQLGMSDSKQEQYMFSETMADFDCMSLVMTWQKNKQVYRFDKDFTDELLRTENLRFAKDAWCYLPYKLFYVDISDNQELCQKINCEGFFVRPDLTKKLNKWNIHICKVNEKFFFRDVLEIPNEDKTITLDQISQSKYVNLIDMGSYTDIKAPEVSIVENDARLFSVLVAQILTYLASVEPDIEENPETKKTYRKPVEGAKPKNKFSEVRQWDVGLRFGTSYRKWKKSASSGTNRGSHPGAVGVKKRPHFRRAHWTHYWYNVTDGNGEVQKDEAGKSIKVRRPKWVAETFINMNYSEVEEAPTVVHDTK